MISYYELLGLIKEDKMPKRIAVNLCNDKFKNYIIERDGYDFNYYRIEDTKQEDENYQYYLSECFLESDMFRKTIKILDEFKDIELLNLEFDDLVNNKDIRPIDYLFEGTINQLIKNQKKILEEIKKYE
jgi:hypothetical protein